MTRKDIIHQLAERGNLSPSQATHAVEDLIDILADAIVAGDTIYLRGFGSFKVVTRAAKTARDIQKGTTILVPERRCVKFVTYNDLQMRINGNEV